MNPKNISTIVNLVHQKNSLQSKMIKSVIANQDHVYEEKLEYFLGKLFLFLDIKGIKLEYVVDSYLKMCQEMFLEQIKFKKTGFYSCQKASDANRLVYSNKEKMTSYMYGLALSQFFWPNHYTIYNFFINESSKLTNVKSFLEVGPGHGLFLAESLKLFSHSQFKAVDISPISIKISQEIVKHFVPNSRVCQFEVQDVKNIGQGRYDYIVMCEVLEHLDSPSHIMKNIYNLLSSNGHLFITTCANCPAVDHVYLYKNLKHIRQEIKLAGFKIVSDLPLSVDDCSIVNSENENIALNYAAMLYKE